MGSFRDKLTRFMYGRYGIDKLYYALAILSFVLLVINAFVHSSILSIIVWIILILMIYRVLSKNIYKRQKENAIFIKAWNWLKSKILLAVRRIKEIRTHRYHRCPHCKAMLRLPRKRGKHTVQCPRCKEDSKMRVII
ncbi:MAG: hypothetical protein GX283_00625 [Clostridiaceae bacterium]|jgi:hypothetical protein|nr:hypothetical protein [Clostridiaceae bacterium]